MQGGVQRRRINLFQQSLECCVIRFGFVSRTRSRQGEDGQKCQTERNIPPDMVREHDLTMQLSCSFVVGMFLGGIQMEWTSCYAEEKV